MTAMVAGICRHPIKGIGREVLTHVTLSPGEGLPWDRHWAVAHEAANIVPGWNPCANFVRGAKAPALMAVCATLDPLARRITLRHPAQGELVFRPDDADDAVRFLDWLRPLVPDGRAQPAGIVAAGRAMTDSDYASVSIISLASCRDLGARMNAQIDPHRWRGNLWIDGAAPFAEFDWVGRQVRIGKALLQVVERIERCRATSANPATGVIDADTLGALHAGYGHQHFGVYARVIEGGTIQVDDALVVT